VQESTDLGPEALAGTSTRGIAYWRNAADERILSVRPPYLYAINLKTGELIRSFGEAGKVDLRTSLGPQPQPFNLRRRRSSSRTSLSSVLRLPIIRTSRKELAATYAVMTSKPGSSGGRLEPFLESASSALRLGKTGRGNIPALLTPGPISVPMKNSVISTCR